LFILLVKYCIHDPSTGDGSHTWHGTAAESEQPREITAVLDMQAGPGVTAGHVDTTAISSE
jgi:hypothetical protein